MIGEGDNQFQLFDALPEAILILDRRFQIRFWNRIMEQWTDISRIDALGRDLRILLPCFKNPVYASRLEPLFSDGVPVIFSSQFHPHLFPSRLVNGTWRTEQTIVSPLSGREEEPLALFTVIDVTPHTETLKKLDGSIKEKELLIREVHHRVKNNLNLVSSLIGLQAENLKKTERKLAPILDELRAKIDSLSLLYTKLYKGKVTNSIDLKEYLEELIENLFQSTLSNTSRISLHLSLAPLTIKTDRAIALGLIAVELFTNALKHAFPGGEEGNISVELLSPSEHEIELSVYDDGQGLPRDFEVQNCNTFGVVVITGLAKQIGGNCCWEGNKEKGTRFRLLFPGDP
ncbi:sensor histidine kinase [Sediminispirochaeta smaragdinae]|jgi:PAS domain S-box-containing protein|uniref:histidine kinase n=1 Tax=Sediminispirochaeta smaragdinae (strain DSM 11293 / JCM 15392 / SEBR 4228) TaxID=573413 RepID=E1R1Q5_SEDSS|nr:histidine kinase dimerization/phosphoacceptor domain -containing protein [Sediminispirochaeta smaragdinae]ADK81431.1 signal transduction histidine kinase [Sediminispirochaeta smaragdinae DSM 11293]